MHTTNLIFDGTNLEYRIFHVAQSYKAHNGLSSLDLVSRYLATFKNLVNKFNPENIYSSWDHRLQEHSTNFRKQILDGQYKAGRSKPDNINELFNEEPKIIELLSSLGVMHIYPNVLEADDVIAWLAKNVDGQSIIVSADRDMLQLVDESTSVWNFKKLITHENFTDHVGIEAKYYKLYKAIMGDVSDNIHGIPGYGKVRSVKLATSWGEYPVSDDYKEIVERNLKLIDLDYGYTTEVGESDAYQMQMDKERVISPGDIETFKELCVKYGLRKELDKINEWKSVTSRNNLVSMINSLLL